VSSSCDKRGTWHLMHMDDLVLRTESYVIIAKEPTFCSAFLTVPALLGSVRILHTPQSLSSSQLRLPGEERHSQGISLSEPWVMNDN
jgi:hypothetical protein